MADGLHAFFFLGGIVNYTMLMLTILFVLQIEDYLKGGQTAAHRDLPVRHGDAGRKHGR